jgi:hypothetical protein
MQDRPSGAIDADRGALERLAAIVEQTCAPRLRTHLIAPCLPGERTGKRAGQHDRIPTHGA